MACSCCECSSLACFCNHVHVRILTQYRPLTHWAVRAGQCAEANAVHIYTCTYIVRKLLLMVLVPCPHVLRRKNNRLGFSIGHAGFCAPDPDSGAAEQSCQGMLQMLQNNQTCTDRLKFLWGETTQKCSECIFTSPERISKTILPTGACLTFLAITHCILQLKKSEMGHPPKTFRGSRRSSRAPHSATPAKSFLGGPSPTFLVILGTQENCRGSIS